MSDEKVSGWSEFWVDLPLLLIFGAFVGTAVAIGCVVGWEKGLKQGEDRVIERMKISMYEQGLELCRRQPK